ncbi:MAG: dual specificity protein phosphatase family protein [Anaerolineales bacterium]|nr:dual specificity protein phosphatase family protein [Anaerolineales bacterium]
MIHIYNNIYLTNTEDFLASPDALRAAGFHLVIDTPTAPFPALSQRIHETVEAGQRVLVYCDSPSSPLILPVLGYLIRYVGMSLANAYTLLTVRYDAFNVDWDTLIQAYDLPYSLPITAPDLLAEARTTISNIYPDLYVSGIEALEDLKLPQQADIQAVLRLDNTENSPQWPDSFSLLYVPVPDGKPIPATMFRQGTAFIADQLNAGHAVLVHCQAGISRSTTLALAYLIEYEGMSLPEAFARIVANRPMARPHPVLMISLARCYELPYSDAEIWSDYFVDNLLAEAVHRP